MNKLIIASAGSGKTTHLVKEALAVKNKVVLITTYTEANEEAIKRKIIIENKFVPENIIVQTWFSFLLKHGVRPYQGVLYKKKIKGLLLVNSRSGVKYTNSRGFPVCYKEDTEFENHYFSKGKKIYSDKLSKFVIKANKESKGAVISRLEKIIDILMIDEVQDLAGNDLEFIKLILKSDIELMMVGDPRQVTYLTHLEAKHKPYRNGMIKNFIEEKCKRIEVEIDETTLNKSHRCVGSICRYSSKLYPDFVEAASNQTPCENHNGIFIISKCDVDKYLEKYSPVQLRRNKATKTNTDYKAMNFGMSKGLTFDRVLIYPTEGMIEWMKDEEFNLKDQTRAKFYVALTRAKYSVGIITDEVIENDLLTKYNTGQNNG